MPRRSKRLIARRQLILSSCLKIQRCFRGYIDSLPNDPITQDKLEMPIFKCIENDRAYYFSADTISDYILSTGDIRNPLTRTEFSRADIEKLEKLSKKKIFSKIEKARREEEMARNIESLYQYFEQLIYDACNDILEECSNVETDFSHKVISCKITARVCVIPTLFSLMNAIHRYDRDNWEEHCMEKANGIISFFESHKISQLYYEEDVITDIQRAIYSSSVAKIDSLKEIDDNDL